MFILAIVQQNSQLLRKTIGYRIENELKVSRDRLTLEMYDLPSNLWVTGKWREELLWAFFCIWGVMWQKRLLCVSVLTTVWRNFLLLRF